MQDYFDIIYIINLPHRLDRKKEIEDQFSNIGLAIDGDQIRIFPAVRPDTSAGFPNVGARGCFMSHLAVLTHARDCGARSLLIIEDDCNFVKNFVERMRVVQAAIEKSEWTFFYGGSLNAIKEEQLQNGWLSPTQSVMGSHFLAVNGAVLPALVRYLDAMLSRPSGDPFGGPMHVDGAYSWFRAANPQHATYLAVPELAYQRSSATDIHQKKWYESFFLMQWILNRLRKLKNIIMKSKR